MIETPLRQRLDLDRGWEFVRRRGDSSWLTGRGDASEVVDLPHCWNREDTYQPGRRSYSGFGAYRRAFELPAPPGRNGAWRLRSDGFYGVGEVWLDGRRVARVDGQYLGVDVDLPPSLAPGRHLLAVRIDNLFHRNVLPGRRDPDFLLYGGLAGKVWCEWRPARHIDASSATVRCAPGAAGVERLELCCSVAGRGAAGDDATLSWVVTSAAGAQVASVGPAPIADHAGAMFAEIAGPRCWSPDDPYLYWAEARLEDPSGQRDVVRVRFGISRAEFRPEQGFLLAGERIDLHGCNRHESIPGLGSALPPELHRADARLLKDYGCNFVRLSHYPQHPTFLDACDELGILVCAEIASWKSVRSSSAWRRAARRQMRDLVLRDRHHPSVILWSMGNESRSHTAYLELRRIARELDPARPVTYAENHLRRARRQRTIGIPDVWGINYELGELEAARDASRLRTVIITECCNHPVSVRGDDREELAQVATLQRDWATMADHAFVAGHAVWSFSDYATEYRRRFRRQTGLFDAWRRPKMAAELFRARFADQPFVSLFMTGRDDGPIVHVFTNCRRVRLQRDDGPPLELGDAFHQAVPVTASFSRITVEGERHGVTVVEELHRWGEAALITVQAGGALEPETTVPVNLTVADDQGLTVRDWDGHVRVVAEGAGRILAYTENGDVLLARGQGRCYLVLGDQPGEVVVSVTADGLAESTATMVVVARSHRP